MHIDLLLILAIYLSKASQTFHTISSYQAHPLTRAYLFLENSVSRRSFTLCQAQLFYFSLSFLKRKWSSCLPRRSSSTTSTPSSIPFFFNVSMQAPSSECIHLSAVRLNRAEGGSGALEGRILTVLQSEGSLLLDLNSYVCSPPNPSSFFSALTRHLQSSQLDFCLLCWLIFSKI